MKLSLTFPFQVEFYWESTVQFILYPNPSRDFSDRGEVLNQTSLFYHDYRFSSASFRQLVRFKEIENFSYSRTGNQVRKGYSSGKIVRISPFTTPTNDGFKEASDPPHRRRLSFKNILAGVTLGKFMDPPVPTTSMGLFVAKESSLYTACSAS